jgi:RES domain-containing protein
MHRGRRLSEAVHACPRVRVHGVWYRSVDGAVFLGFYDKKNPKRPLWGLGAPRGGARFTPKNGPPSLYVAEDVDTANREGLQVTLGTPLRPSAGVTRATYTVEVEISDVIDLRERSVRDHLGTNLAELCAPWRYRKDRSKPPTQRLRESSGARRLLGIALQVDQGSGSLPRRLHRQPEAVRLVAGGARRESHP